MKLKLTTLLVGLLISFSIFGQKIFNNSYKLEKENFKVSLIPILNEYNSFNDTIMLKIFKDNLNNVQFVTPHETRKIISTNQKVQEILNKIILTDYNKKELKTFPNLTTLLESSEIEYLKKELEQSDFVLIPIAFNFKPVGNYTFGYTKFRFYNLNSGEFIFEFSDDMNVNVSGERGIKGLTGVLLSVVYDYYRNKFLKKYKIE